MLEVVVHVRAGGGGDGLGHVVEEEGGFAVGLLRPVDLDGDALPFAGLDEDGAVFLRLIGAVGDADAELALQFTETKEHGRTLGGKAVPAFTTSAIRLIVPLADDPPAILWCIGHETLWHHEAPGVAHGVALLAGVIDADLGADAAIELLLAGEHMQTEVLRRAFAHDGDVFDGRDFDMGEL